MTHLILFVLSAYACWYVFTTAELPGWAYLRDELAHRSVTFFKFIDCPICSGFWVSLALALVFPLLSQRIVWFDPWFADMYLEPVVQAFAGAGAIYLIETHVRRLEEQ